MSETHTETNLDQIHQRRRGRQGSKRISWDRDSLRSLIADLLREYPANEARDILSEKVRADDNLFDAVIEYTWANLSQLYKQQPIAASFSHPPPASPVQLEAMKGRARRRTKSLLETYLIDGKPLGECTAGLCRSQAALHGLHRSFLMALTDGLNAEDVIGKVRSNDDVYAAMVNAIAEYS